MTQLVGDHPIYISITGLIGAGKSTAARALAQHFGVPYYAEKVAENRLLVDFYKDMAKHGFALQLELLNNRAEQQQLIIHKGEGGVQDKAIQEDLVFARVLNGFGMMSDIELGIYTRTLRNFSKHMARPHFIVHLRVSPAVALERIQKRIAEDPEVRKMEKGIDLAYLTKLEEGYDRLIGEFKDLGIPVLDVDWNSFRTTDQLVQQVKKAWDSIQNVHRITFVKQQQSQ